MPTFLAAYLAGALSTLSPCVLPLLPVLLAAAPRRHHLAPLALAAGLALSFTAFGLLMATIGFALGLDQDMVRRGAAALMLVFGLVLAVPPLGRGFARLAAPLAGGGNAALARVSGEGGWGRFGLGLILGGVWSPCAGPTLGAAIGLAAQGGSVARAGSVMAVFAIGTVTPLLLLAFGSRGLIERRGLGRDLGHWAAFAKPAFGLVVAMVGAAVLTGLDTRAETVIAAAMPASLAAFAGRF